MQSNYIPWKGYFDIIRSVDELIVFDDAQYTKNSWRNRNIIKTQDGPVWLTVPILTKGKLGQRVDEATVRPVEWAGKHLRTLTSAYSKAPFFAQYIDQVSAAYEQAARESHLSRINRLFIDMVCEFLGIRTSMRDAVEYSTEGTSTDRLVSICAAARAAVYISGPAAKSFIEVEKFSAIGCNVEYIDYSGYPEYKQLHGSFEHAVTVLDLIFNKGPEAIQYLDRVPTAGSSPAP